ncbi:hypothetical protein B9Z55_003719 [Caenorhabditis nigoni]|uniref:Uncharacterized protein n=1 Tax=Caenorhabditis nigoni TaxID=1611254 RepID=A0A2G5VRM6_9PELO|nr:hypothetical protein B9Z55_003719 [Caenorhabditis nigoni]
MKLSILIFFCFLCPILAAIGINNGYGSDSWDSSSSWSSESHEGRGGGRGGRGGHGPSDHQHVHARQEGRPIAQLIGCYSIEHKEIGVLGFLLVD